MAEETSDRATARRSHSGSSTIADRTASDVFASLAADGPTVDTDAILDGTSPDEIVERTNDPEPASSVDSSLFDEAELTELILPDRHSDGTFLWVETTESATPTEPEPSETISIRTWQDTEYDGSHETATPPSTAMTDASDTRQTDASTRPTSAADSTGFDTDDRPKAGKVPPRTDSSTTDTGSAGGETGRRDRNRTDPTSTRKSGSQSRERMPEPDAETASKSEIRTSVQYFEGRNPETTSSGIIASVKRVVSTVFRAGRSG